MTGGNHGWPMKLGRDEIKESKRQVWSKRNGDTTYCWLNRQYHICILRWWWLTSSDNNDCMHPSNKSANGLQPLSFLTHSCVNIHHRFDDNCYNFQFPTNSDQPPLRFTHTHTHTDITVLSQRHTICLKSMICFMSIDAIVKFRSTSLAVHSQGHCSCLSSLLSRWLCG